MKREDLTQEEWDELCCEAACEEDIEEYLREGTTMKEWQIDTVEKISRRYFVLADSKEEALAKWKESLPHPDDGATTGEQVQALGVVERLDTLEEL